MKDQINLVNQLQELVLTRDEHRQTAGASHMAQLDASIEALQSKLDAKVCEIYQRLYKKDHVVMAQVINGACSVCGMHLPISQVQQVRLGKTLQLCSNCGRMLCDSDESAPHAVPPPPGPRGPRKTGVSRFSSEDLMVADLKATTAEEAIRELATLMEEHNFISNAPALVVAAMERESILSTAVGNDIALPHVRGVEGGGMALALGVSKEGIDFDRHGTMAHFIFLTVIPAAVSAFYLRLMAGISETFSKETNRKALLAAKNPAELWKALVRTTRTTIQ